MIGQFYKVHQKRFDNYFQKRRPTHAIFSRQAMEQFAQTGLESDHFFAIRPFSPAERVSILTHLKEQNETNPNFCLYFFKPGYRQPRTEIACTRARARCSPWPIRITTFPARTRRC